MRSPDLVTSQSQSQTRRPTNGRRVGGRRGGVLVSCAVLVLGLLSMPAGAAPAPTAPAAPQSQNPVKILVFHGAAAEQEDPVSQATEAIEALGRKHDFAVDESTDPAVFTPRNLAAYRGVVFLSAKGVDLSNAQSNAFQRYINQGGGFVGIHDAAEVEARSDWFTGLVGTRPAGALPDPEQVVEVTASGENPPNETKEKLVDGDVDTKWLTFAPTGWVAVRLAEPAVVDRYSLTSANDVPERDPQDWTLQGSQDGQTWTDLDTRTGQEFDDRFQTRDFAFTNDQAFPWYRLDITRNAGSGLTQLAEMSLFRHDATPPEEVEPEVQQATVSVVDRQHPATRDLPLTWTRSDQWLNWSPNPVSDVHTVAQVQEHTYDPGAGALGAFHPVSWCRDYDGGRSFYTGMGATPASWTSDGRFQSHVAGAILWATGMVRGDCQATIAENYEVQRLSGANSAGALDQHGEMHGLDVAPDGTVFYIGKAACPTGPIPDWENPNVGLGCGTIHQWDPQTKKVKLLTTLDVFGNRGSGGELVKSEDGLVGIALDPDFAENGWVYVYWMPYESIDRDLRIGKRTISRFTYDARTQSIDKASRVDVLEWPAQIHSCCHLGGGMDFDADGNLYIGSGDNTSSQGSSGYSANNWTQDFKGLSFQDARRTSGNTNDLNGKILRIHPEDDGSYAIPEGNLFPESEDPGDKTRPEIYVMGVRNISTLSIDPETDWLNAAWVGPDAGTPSPELGPAKYDSATVITSAGNQGWPFCMGDNQPYRDRSNEDASILTGWYECRNLKNTSPRNTGLVDIPPSRDNMVWYSPQGGGPVYPTRNDGSGLPTYVLGDETFTQPYLKGGCQAIMSGPTYHAAQIDKGSNVAWPSYWEDKWFMGDECNPRNRVAVTLAPDSVEKSTPPAFAETLQDIIPSGSDDNELQSWMMTSKFGPDGALYMSDYGGAFFSLNERQKLIRVVYKGGPATPAPTASAVAVNNTPMRVAFTGERSGGVAYEWDFGDGGTSSAANPRHTYTAGGTYTAKLAVSYADGETSSTTTEVDVTCENPDDRETVWFRDTDTGVTNHPLGGGCTMNDLFDDERDWSSHGEFVSYVADLSNRLHADGTIDDAERDALSEAAAESGIGGPHGEPGYVPIFDGTAESLKGWTQAPSGSFDLQPDGTIRSVGGLGMLWYSDAQFGDFSLKLQFRDVSPADHRANSGVFVRFPDPRTPLEQRPECGRVGAARTSPAWVAIFCGQEVQIYDGATGEPQKTGSIYNFDRVGLDGAGVTPKGQWNDYEIRVVGQHYTIIRNGQVINEFDNTPGQESSRAGDPPTDLRQFSEGFVGLQNHGNNDVIEFRDIRVKELP